MPCTALDHKGVKRFETTAAADTAIEVKSKASNTVNYKLTGAGYFGVAGTTPPTSRTTYTQTYSTADATISAYTSADASQSTAFTGGTTDSALALNSNLNALRVSYELLRAHAEDIGKGLNSVIDTLQAFGLGA